MSGPLAMYEVRVKHLTTREEVKFLGQGTSVADAISDAIKNAMAPFRPSLSGGARPGIGLGVPSRVAVTLPGGEAVLRKLEAFESGEPYSREKEAA